MAALALSGVEFPEIRSDGTVERWEQPALEDWERPRRDPAEPRPRHPDVLARDREAQRRRRERQRALKIATSAA
jgi:hypothetical protein